jgi:TonB family protein
MRSTILCSLAAAVFVIFPETDALSSEWLSAPRPKFPPSALRKGVEGSVKLKLVLTRDGTVTSGKILRSSGNSVLDETAQSAVLKWKLKPNAIKSSDLTKGRVEEIEFRQEAAVAAIYPDRAGAFTTNTGAIMEATPEQWMFAPFPSYPLSERRLRHTGRVILYGRIGEDGHVVDVRVLQSSGYPELDRCGAAALRLWRAHKKYAGTQFKQPIIFNIGR